MCIRKQRTKNSVTIIPVDAIKCWECESEGMYAWDWCDSDLTNTTSIPQNETELYFRDCSNSTKPGGRGATHAGHIFKSVSKCLVSNKFANLSFKFVNHKYG